MGEASKPQIDCTRPANDFFNNVRMPAAMLTGASLGAMWTTFGDDAKRFPKLQGLFTVLCVFSVCFLLSTVVFSSLSIIHLMTAPNMNTKATNCVEFLATEFEFPWIAVRLFFLTGIICFLLSICVRVSFAFHKRPKLGKACSSIILAAICSIINFYNFTLANRGTSYFGMWWTLAEIYYRTWLGSQWQSIWPWMAVAFLCHAVYQLTLSFTRNVFYTEVYSDDIDAIIGQMDQDKSGTVSKEEALEELRKIPKIAALYGGKDSLSKGCPGEAAMQAVFDSLDHDGNGEIKNSELLDYFHTTLREKKKHE